MLTITSRNNERVRDARALTLAKERHRTGFHFAEGEKLVHEAFASGCGIQTVFIEEGYGTEETVPAGIEAFFVTRSVMEALCESKTPQHICAVVRTPDMTPPKEYPKGLIVVLDGVQDPGNTGTILRTADALGAGGVLTGIGTADPFSPKTLRSSMGSAYHLPVWSGEAAEELRVMKEQGAVCIAGHLKGDKTLPRIGERTALVIGNEGNGVSERAAEECTLYRLPMRGRAESLNAAVAAALMIWQISERMESVE